MILLTSTSDLIQVITGGALAVDVHASWVDLNAGSVTPGRTNTAISTATTTTVVASPGASTQRTLKTLVIRNKSVSPDAVTVQHYDGATTVQLIKIAALPSGSVLSYNEGAGWSVISAAGSLQTVVGT